MVMDIGLFGTLRKLKLASASLRIDDDFVDRLNHYYTAVLIILFTFVISAKQYVGQPLQCWVPAHFTEAMEQYAENYCWVQNTYYLPIAEDIPREQGHRHERKIGYYQWVPFMLVCQAMLFYLPHVIWKLLNWESGINFRAISRMTSDAQDVGPENRSKTIRVIARHISDALKYQKRTPKNCSEHIRATVNKLLLCSRRYGVYLTLLYFFVKLMYIVNCVGQFFLLNAFLGTNYHLFGLQLFRDIVSGTTWENSGQFPRVTMCDFEIRVLGNLHRHTVQCVLVINLFNEKIFLFLWFWLLFVAAASSVSLLLWLWRQAMPFRRLHFLRSLLRMSDDSRGDYAKKYKRHRSVEDFLAFYLRSDGAFVLRMVAINAGEIIAAEVARELYSDYDQKYKKACNNSNSQGGIPPDDSSVV